MQSAIIFGYAFVAAILGLFIESFNGHDKKPLSVAIWTFVLSLIVNWATVWLFNAPFTHPLTGGYISLVYINLILVIVVSLLHGIENDATMGAAAGVALTVVVIIVNTFVGATTTPAWCDTAGQRQQISLLNLQQAPAGMVFHPTSLDQLIRVPMSAALTKAGNELSSGQNSALGNYLQPDEAYLTKDPNGVPVYIVNLAVTEVITYRANANPGMDPGIPGYLIVNAVNNTANAEYRSGYYMPYAQDALFSYDLARKVYFDFALPKGVQIRDLRGMEIDNAYKPGYTGTVMEHTLSYKGVQPTGVYAFDPATGFGEFVPLADVPTKLPHLDRVIPLDWVLDQVTLWGKFANHEACDTFTSSGQYQIDSYNEVITPNGVEYQITMTGMGDDPSMTHLITVDAKTGQGYIFDMRGKSVYSIKEQFKTLTKQIRNVELTVDECELHAIDGVNTVYCIFTNSDADGNTNISGYGFVAVDRAENDADYALADTFDGAYNEYLRIRSTADANTVIANSANDIVVPGTVASNQQVSTDEGFTRLINVRGDDGKDYWFMADGSSKNAAAATEGRHVTVTGYQREGLSYLTVRYITVAGVPDFGNSLWAGVEFLKSLFDK